jgi:hypothetical protein
MLQKDFRCHRILQIKPKFVCQDMNKLSILLKLTVFNFKFYFSHKLHEFFSQPISNDLF